MTKDNIQSWSELESDPGVKGVEVEEVYDLNDTFNEDLIFGFIFLFKWVDDNRRYNYSRRKYSQDQSQKSIDIGTNKLKIYLSHYLNDSNLINKMFFAKQVVPNSCATHALLSVILNRHDIDIGENLSNFKQYTHLYTPENKGHAIANMKVLANSHNKFARNECDKKDPPLKQQKESQSSNAEKRCMNDILTNHIDGHNKMTNSSMGKIEASKETIDNADKMRAPSSHIKANDLPINKIIEETIKGSNELTLTKEFIQKTTILSNEIASNHNNPDCKSATKNTESQEKAIKNNLLNENCMTESYNKSASPKNNNDCFHYVSFVPIDGELFELDGLKPFPINHGSWSETENWTDKFKDIIVERINVRRDSNNDVNESSNPVKDNQETLNNSREIRYNLMAVCVDKRMVIRKKLLARKSQLFTSLEFIPEALKKVDIGCYKKFLNIENDPTHIMPINMHENVKEIEKPKLLGDMLVTLPDRVKKKFVHHVKKFKSLHSLTPNELVSHDAVTPDFKDFITFLYHLQDEINECHEKLSKENEKWARYKVEDARRTHDYTPFINAFLKALSEHKILGELIENNMTSYRTSKYYARRIVTRKGKGSKK
ncbi:unnamed protein product [Gordionus sp. m RMFG-2023]